MKNNIDQICANAPELQADEGLDETPCSPGYWWAKTGNCKWPNIMVQVRGNAPFLRLRGWDLMHNTVKDLEVYEIKEWVVEIPSPDTLANA